MDTTPTSSDVNDQVMQSPMPPRSSGNTGATIGIAIVLLLLIAGGWYFWTDAKRKADQTAQEQAAQEAIANDQQAQALSHTSSSDTASAIEADLNATNLGNIDGELQAAGSQI